MTTEPQLWRKSLSGLIPITETARRVVARAKLGSVLRTDVHEIRNGKHSAKFWVMLDKIAENMTDTPAEVICDLVKIRTGHVHIIKTKSGIERLPKSISFAKMDQIKFEAFYDAAVQFICEEVLPIAPDELVAEVNALLEGRS